MYGASMVLRTDRAGLFLQSSLLGAGDERTVSSGPRLEGNHHSIDRLQCGRRKIGPRQFSRRIEVILGVRAYR